MRTADAKQINLTSRAARNRELAVQLRLMARLENTYAPKYRSLFAINARAMARAYLAGGKQSAAIAASSIKGGLKTVLLANMRAAMVLFGERTKREFSRAAKGGHRSFDTAIQEYLNEFGTLRIDQITEVTRKRMLDVILAGEAEGLPISEIAASITEQMGGSIARVRAQTIAITETHSAATYASDAVAEESGLELTRVWVAAEDDRTRPTHSDADGQRRRMGKPFTVGGASLDRPGDPNGPAQEVIRCRCVLIYEEN